MSLATTHLLNHQLATITARHNALQMQINEIRSSGSTAPAAAEAEPRDPARAEAELVLRIESSVVNSLRFEFAEVVRDAVQRERQAIDKRLAAVSDELRSDLKAAHKAAEALRDRLIELEASVDRNGGVARAQADLLGARLSALELRASASPAASPAGEGEGEAEGPGEVPGA